MNGGASSVPSSGRMNGEAENHQSATFDILKFSMIASLRGHKKEKENGTY